MPTNRAIINKAKEAITTATMTSGLLNAEQSRQFIQQTFDATALGPLVRHEMRTAKTGEIDKIGIAKRIIRSKTENADDGYRATVTPSSLSYATTPVRVPWEITEETLRENIEGQNYESIVTNMMTTQVGVDSEDLYLNGDTATASSDADYDFLKINDGWVKQIKNGGHVTDMADKTVGLDMFYNAVASVPNKYNNGKLRWIMSPHRAQEWELFLMNKIIDAGGAVPDSVYSSPVSIPHIECPSLSDDIILLTDPKNLIVVNTYDMKIRKTTEGKEAIMQDKRFYVIHFDFDPIIEELDATAIITNIGKKSTT